MPYLTLSTPDGRRLARHSLHGLAVLGRSAECDIRVHDIMASREHCGIEPAPEGWVVVDLYSSNGTVVNGQRIVRHVLAEGDELLLGRTLATFHEGVILDEEEQAPRAGLLERAADPHEALAGTLVDFEFNPDFEQPVERPIIRPTPRPIPRAVSNRDRRKPLYAQADPVSHENISTTHVADSSPTWATRPQSPPSRGRLTQSAELASILDAALDPAPTLAQLRATELSPAKKSWRRRTLTGLLELLLIAALAGASLLAATILLGRTPAN